MKFCKPVQVKFYDYYMEEYHFGIAYDDVIICGCCGGAFEISEILEFAPKDIEPITVYHDWVDLEDSIHE